MADYAGWMQAGVAGLVAAVGTVFWAGSTNRVISDTQATVQQLQIKQQTDHDQIVGQEQRLKDIQSDVQEIKGDVKTIAQKVH